jgi:hypothetical protein
MNWSMGKRREGNNTPQKKNSIEDLVGNEENGYPVPDPNKTMTNVTNEPSDTHKTSLKEEIMEEVTAKLMEKILNMVNQKVQDAPRNFKTPQIKNLRRHRNN